MFKIVQKSKSSKARLGTITTPHGKLITPAFMPDATRGLIKMVESEAVKSTGTEAIVVNTFHLYLQPGTQIIKKHKGIHNFMNWTGPLLSDSGGYQVFSLIHKNKQLGKIFDDKVIFKSPLNGSTLELTPEKSIQIQFDLGVDMMVCLDDCPPNEFNRTDLEKSVKRTIDWAKRCRKEFDAQIKKRKLAKSNRPLLFAVIQGGAELDLRKKCAEELVKIGFDGYGFGARPVDKDGKFLAEVLAYTADLIPENKIRFALGIGTPEDIVKCAHMGWDLFDCVIPTREARHGRLYKFKTQHSAFKINSKFSPPGDHPSLNKKLPNGKLGEKIQTSKFYEVINILNSKYKSDTSKIIGDYTAAYFHHLFKIKEPLGMRLASLHNLEFYAELINQIRLKIK